MYETVHATPDGQSTVSRFAATAAAQFAGLLTAAFGGYAAVEALEGIWA